MKKLSFTLEETKENKSDGRIQIYGQFDQCELTALMEVILSQARMLHMCPEEMENLLERFIIKHLGHEADLNAMFDHMSMN